MKVVHGWLQAFVDGPLPGREALAETLTGVGIEVEEIDTPGDLLRGVQVAEVAACGPHPDADRLKVCRIFDGRETHDVVCGAPNVRTGMKVAFARPGITLPGGLTLEVRKVRGVRSAGMLCSGRELGLSEDHDGILDLEGSLETGTELAGALGLDEVVYTLGLTPNRPDALSHLGVARDLAAVLGFGLRFPSSVVPETGRPASAKTAISIEAPAGCGRYAARLIEGLKVAPSPGWMQARLRLCGVRPISNVVDVTNYVLLELGHPLHAFDLDRLHGERIRVRFAEADERFSTLDGVERKLKPEDLLIADADRAVALAGIMGGLHSEVSATTTRVLLESAHFEATTIRRSARRHGLHTEASHRFERGADPLMVPTAADRAAALLVEVAGGQVASGLLDTVATPHRPTTVRLRFGRVKQVLGTDVSPATQLQILHRLGFEFATVDAEGSDLISPSFRTEMGREIDLIEEIARIHGYDRIPATIPPQDRPADSVEAHDPVGPMPQGLRRVALAADAAEVVNYSFVAPQSVRAMVGEGGAPEQRPIRITNPLSNEQSVMRTQLCQSLLDNLQLNRRYLADRVRLFELGRVYLATEAGTHEPERFAVLLWGPREAKGWTRDAGESDVYDLIGVLEGVGRALGLASTDGRSPRLRAVASDAHAHLHPCSAASILLGEAPIGWLGELHPRIAEDRGHPRGVMLLELDVAPLAQAANLLPKAPTLPRFPPLLRDLAVVLEEGIEAEQVSALLARPLPEAVAMGARLLEARLFDVYTGAQVGEGRRSLAFALKFIAEDRTLKDEEADALQAALLARLTREIGVAQRS